MLDCSCSSHSGFLTAKGLKEAAQREGNRPEVDAMETSLYLDKVGSVSGIDQLDFIFDDCLLEDQYRRFHNGS